MRTRHVDRAARHDGLLVGQRIDDDAGGLRERFDEVGLLAGEDEVNVGTGIGWAGRRLQRLTCGASRAAGRRASTGTIRSGSSASEIAKRFAGGGVDGRQLRRQACPREVP